MSKIEWTEETWNVTTGCTRVSAGCDNCYAVTMTNRLGSMKATKQKYGGLINKGKNHFNGTVKLHETELTKPLHWKRPRKIFVNSMSDLFHSEVPFEFIDKVFAVMALTPQHTYQVLTKRPERMAEYFHEKWQASPKSGLAYDTYMNVCDAAFHIVSDKTTGKLEEQLLKIMFNDSGNYAFQWPLPNVWLGTSVENQPAAQARVPHLLRCPATVRFLSCEPLLGQVDISKWLDNSPPLKGVPEGRGMSSSADIHWVIVGGESGSSARPMHPDWARSLYDQCQKKQTPFFFKQWGEWKEGFDAAAKESNKVVLKDGSVYRSPAPRTHIMQLYSEVEWNENNPCVMSKLGKKEFGRLLYGKEHNQFPNPSPPGRGQRGGFSQPATSNKQPAPSNQ